MDVRALAEQSAALGMRWAFGVPGGGTSLQLVDEWIRRGVRFLTTGHETTAALMAGAVARVTGAPSAAIAIKGPGLMNLAPGLLANAYEGYPMLSFAEAYDAQGASARRHKWLPHGDLLRSFTRGYGYCDARADLVARCWGRARSEFPGPVHLELAEGPGPDLDADEPLADDPGAAVARVERSQRPAVIVGSMALRAAWRARLAGLAVPVFSTVAAKGVVSEHASHAAGIFTGDGKPLTPEKRVLPLADLAVAIGVRSGEVLDTRFPAADALRLDVPAVRGDLFPPQSAEASWHLDDRGFAALLDALARKSWGAEECAGAVSAMEQQLVRVPWSPAQACRVIAEALPDVVHVLDTGNFTVVGEHVLRARDEHDVFGTPNGRYMGLGVGYALGAALAGGRPAVLWIGDGGIRAFLGELCLAVEHELPLLVLVMADGYFGSIRGRAIKQGWSTEPLRMQGRDLRRIAEAIGLEALAVDREDRLADAVTGWGRRARPLLVRCDFDPEEYTSVADLLR